MNFLLSRVAIAAAVLLGLAPPVTAQTVTLPQINNAGGQKVGAVGALLLNPDGSALSGLPLAPTRSTSTSSAGSIASANVYQSVLAASVSRLGCTIQNTSPVNLRVYVGAPGAASDGAALVVVPGGTFGCSSPGGQVLTDQISAASGTQGSTFVVVSQ